MQNDHSRTNDDQTRATSIRSACDARVAFLHTIIRSADTGAENRCSGRMTRRRCPVGIGPWFGTARRSRSWFRSRAGPSGNPRRRRIPRTDFDDSAATARSKTKTCRSRYQSHRRRKCVECGNRRKKRATAGGTGRPKYTRRRPPDRSRTPPAPRCSPSRTCRDPEAPATGEARRRPECPHRPAA